MTGIFRDILLEKPFWVNLSDTIPAKITPTNAARYGILDKKPVLLKDKPFSSVKYDGNQVKKNQNVPLMANWPI